ncbi:uncharacterized protein LOC126456826 [Schistocerca serialis cubense]|uniref:uncharacterized protein LOC126456826 n=1 Tax=Schistocerca serialis cubense TaxID=2023355 RepID=UPI00214EE702|nr:uncharacterized protein LOC126456826 [Schistocerca serialis cubense]
MFINMAAKFNWCVPSTTKLIEMYKADEALYNVRHPEYKNRLRRLESYKNIAEVISRDIRPGCTVEDIKKKIDGLRSSYFHEKEKHEMQAQYSSQEETDVACSEPQPQHHEQPPTKRRKVTTDVIVDVTEKFKAVADMCRNKSQPVRGDRYSALAAHITAVLREMENVGGKAFATDTMQGLIRCLMDRWDLLYATNPQPQLSISGHFQATFQKAGIQEDDTL